MHIFLIKYYNFSCSFGFNSYIASLKTTIAYFKSMDMKKVIILAYDFPPYVSVGGLRPSSWYNYLKDTKVGNTKKLVIIWKLKIY